MYLHVIHFHRHIQGVPAYIRVGVRKVGYYAPKQPTVAVEDIIVFSSPRSGLLMLHQLIILVRQEPEGSSLIPGPCHLVEGALLAGNGGRRGEAAK